MKRYGAFKLIIWVDTFPETRSVKYVKSNFADHVERGREKEGEIKSDNFLNTSYVFTKSTINLEIRI